MKIKLKTNPKTYFRTLLEILSAFKPFDDLTGREKDVLSQIMYFNHLYLEIPVEERNQIISSKTTKEKIRKNINMSSGGLDWALTMLRKKAFITYEGLNPKFLFKYKTEINVNFVEDENKGN